MAAIGSHFSGIGLPALPEQELFGHTHIDHIPGKQFLFTVGYAIEFMVIVIAGTYLGGLDGFVYSALAANAIRFIAVIIWGFCSIRAAKSKSTDMAEAK